MQNRTNFSEMLKIAIKKREIWGSAAFEIVTDKKGNIISFNPLNIRNLRIEIDTKTMKIKKFIYNNNRTISELKPEDVFYVTRDSLNNNFIGISSIESVKSAVNRKWQLEKDLLESSMRLWAPFTLFKYDTDNMSESEDEIRRSMNIFKKELQPGRAVVHNKAVETTIIDMHPNIQSLNEAIDNADQEIMGNWGMPRALLSREKSANKATLEFSIKAMYESNIKSVQQYFANEIEKQIYDKVALNMNKLPSSITHMWKPSKFHDSSLIRALLYGIKQNALTPSQMFEMLNWPIKYDGKMPEDNLKERESLPVEERPVTMQELKKVLKDELEEIFENVDDEEEI